MASGFEVQPEALRAAAAQVTPMGQELRTAVAPSDGPVRAAAAANPGFFVGEALGHTHARITATSQEHAELVRRYGENLEKAATEYLAADEEAAKAFRDIMNSLS